MLTKLVPSRLPPVLINMIDVINQEVWIQFPISLPNYNMYMNNALQDVKEETKLRQVQEFDSGSKTILQLLNQIVKMNCVAPSVGKWNEIFHDFSKREFMKFWDAFFFSERAVDRYFQMLFLKFRYVSMCQNPATLGAEIILSLLKYADRVDGIKRHKDKIRASLRKHFQLFMFHMFRLTTIKVGGKSIKIQGYTLCCSLSQEEKLHLELLLEMVIFDDYLSSRVDSYLFQIAFYWTLQSM